MQEQMSKQELRNLLTKLEATNERLRKMLEEERRAREISERHLAEAGRRISAVRGIVEALL